MLEKKAQIALKLKIRFVRKLATWKVTNSSLETVIFSPKEMLGILDLRILQN